MQEPWKPDLVLDLCETEGKKRSKVTKILWYRGRSAHTFRAGHAPEVTPYHNHHFQAYSTLSHVAQFPDLSEHYNGHQVQSKQ